MYAIFVIYLYTNHINSILSKGEKLNTTDLIKLVANIYYIQYSKEKIIL